jgi:hypothetical protein
MTVNDIAAIIDAEVTIGGKNKVLATALKIAAEREHAPIVLLVGDNDVCPVAGQYKDDEEKDMFVAGIQRIAAAMKAHTSVFIHEAWLTVLPAGKRIPTDEEITLMRTSGVLRQEALIVSIERRGKPPMVVSAMIGVEGGLGTRKVGPFERLPGTAMTGRMLDMLGELAAGGETV